MTFPAAFNIDNLNGTNGFSIVGLGGMFGNSVGGLGDVNGDGMSDLIVGAAEASQAFVVFGAYQFPQAFYLSTLNGSNGFKIVGPQRGMMKLGQSVAGVGDLNGDGKADFVIGAPNTTPYHGEAFVIFGADRFPPRLNVSELDGINGFTIVGAVNGSFGVSLAGLGDINGDGRSDLIIGTGEENQAFVIFGSRRFLPFLNVSQLNGQNGFKIVAASAIEQGVSVSGVGNINGDEIADLALGIGSLGQVYVVFGARSFPAVFYTSSLNGINGFTIAGHYPLGGVITGTCDINGDGKSDIAACAPYANEAFVVFGANSFPAVLNISDLNGINGFKIVGSGERFCMSIAGLGSINDNGKSSVIIGTNMNQAFVLFGADRFAAVTYVNNLNGTNGFELIDTFHNDGFGFSVSGLSNLTGTGKPTFIVGAPSGDLAFVVLDASESCPENISLVGDIQIQTQSS